MRAWYNALVVNYITNNHKYVKIELILHDFYPCITRDLNKRKFAQPLYDSLEALKVTADIFCQRHLELPPATAFWWFHRRFTLMLRLPLM